VTTYAYLLDLGRCIGCQACTAACKTGNELPKGTQYIDLIEKTQGTFPNLKGGFLNHRCYHCADAACVEVCPAGALYKEDGLTRVNQKACTGCEYCVDACPFGVPVMVNGRATKCDACADVVKAGGTPWCVKTCPSHALMYGERSQIMAEARTRLEALKARYPKARIYGETEAGGLGVVMILPDDPETLDLPANPTSPMVLNAWQKVVKPATISLTGISVLFTGVAAIIARRNHVREMASLHRGEADGGQQTADGKRQTADGRRQTADS
jgi:formate dehydrogenase iron-sulfur subunit